MFIIKCICIFLATKLCTSDMFSSNVYTSKNMAKKVKQKPNKATVIHYLQYVIMAAVDL